LCGTRVGPDNSLTFKSGNPVADRFASWFIARDRWDGLEKPIPKFQHRVLTFLSPLQEGPESFMKRLVLIVVAAGVAGCSDYEFVTQNDGAKPFEDTAFIPQDTGVALPVAVCSVAPNPVNPPWEVATWSGEGSYDPNGLAITHYDWKLISVPAGSAATFTTLPGGGMFVENFMPDLAGDYVGQLIVTNADGVQSEACETILESIPAENLWVEMYWTHDGDDMDLHLLRPGAQTESNGDCYYSNCTGGNGLEWGASGGQDNPKLDLDDIYGTGPENINISSPSESSYKVVVHDYPGSTYQQANEVTVNIYLNGSLVWTDTRAISGENSYTNFAEIDWDSGTVSSL